MSDEVREKVLAVLRAPLARRWFVEDLATATGYDAAVLYPVLAQLERRGEVLSHWSPGPSPRRRCYEVPDDAEFARRDAEAASDTVLIDTGTYFVRVPKKPRGES